MFSGLVDLILLETNSITSSQLDFTNFPFFFMYGESSFSLYCIYLSYASEIWNKEMMENMVLHDKETVHQLGVYKFVESYNLNINKEILDIKIRVYFRLVSQTI